ncbi:MAG: multiubiquitin domain-containing protein [Methanoregula sp.]
MNEETAHHEKKDMTIIVNGRPKSWTEKEISFEQVVKLAFDNPPTGPDVIFTVTYHKGPEKKADGSMVAGTTVHIKDGMVFDVKTTNRS